MGENDPHGFEWFNQWVAQNLGLCLTFARGLSGLEMLEALEVDGSTADWQSFNEAAYESRDPRIRAGEEDDWGYTVEQFTAKGMEYLDRLSSSSSPAFSLTFTQTIKTFHFSLAGSLVVGFDLVVPNIRWGTDQHRLDDEIEQAGFLRSEVPEPAAMGAQLVELVFGVRVTPMMLERRLRSSPL